MKADLQAPPAPADELAPALATWRQRLNASGVACRAVAFHSADPRWTLASPAAELALVEAWASLRKRVAGDNPVALGKAGPDAGAHLLVAASLQLPGGQAAIVGAGAAAQRTHRPAGDAVARLAATGLVGRQPGA